MILSFFGNRFIIPEETDWIIVERDETDLGTEFTTVRLRDKDGNILTPERKREPTVGGEANS